MSPQYVTVADFMRAARKRDYEEWEEQEYHHWWSNLARMLKQLEQSLPRRLRAASPKSLAPFDSALYVRYNRRR